MTKARLELYVFESTQAGRDALVNVRRAAEVHFAGADLVVFDLARAPLAAQQNEVLVTPTVILRNGSESRRAFGDFSDIAALVRALGVDAVRA